MPDAEPVPTVTYRSSGRLLIIGPLERAEALAARLDDVLDVSLFATGGAGRQERRYPVLAGQLQQVTGWLGAFQVRWFVRPVAFRPFLRWSALTAARVSGP